MAQLPQDSGGFESPGQNYDFNVIAQQNQAQEQTIRWSIEPREVLGEIELQLRGIEYKEGQGMVQFRKALLNKQGIGSLMILLRSHLNHNNALADLTRQEVMKISMDVAHEVNNQLFLNRKHWELRPEDWSLLNIIVEDQVFAFFTRAIDGKERDSFRGIQRFNESAQPRMSLLNPFKRQIQGGDYGAY